MAADSLGGQKVRRDCSRLHKRRTVPHVQANGRCGVVSTPAGQVLLASERDELEQSV
jgi:hypothetical protein